MKKLILSLVAIATITLSSFGQTPEGFKYQAVVRNASNTILANQAVGLRMTIQQDAIGGTTVYSETFATTTSANGLVNVEIGNGTPISGTFANINWSNGPFFIETAVDITGGTTYTVMGTSQLMSVPYALYAKTSGNGQGPAGPQGNQGLPGTNGSVGATGLTGSQGIQGLPGDNGTVGPTGGYPVHTIGESYGGGIVFYVYDGGQHGLIAATADQSAGIQWHNGSHRYTGTTGDGLVAGAMNTAMIVAIQMADNQAGNFATKVCADYSLTVGGTNYGDWYLPSKYELNLLYLQKDVVGGFAVNLYWSSSEFDNYNAWGQFFDNADQWPPNKDWPGYVRAIRAF